MRKEKILEILENAKDGNGAVPMRLVRTAFDKLPEPCEDTISRQAAIDALAEALKQIGVLDIEDVGFVLSALPPAQPELSHTQKSCEYCHEDSDGYTRPIEKNCHAYIRFGMNGWEIDLKAKGWHGEAQIKFCPMCGRELQGGR